MSPRCILAGRQSPSELRARTKGALVRMDGFYPPGRNGCVTHLSRLCPALVTLRPRIRQTNSILIELVKVDHGKAINDGRNTPNAYYILG
jgi:hypothetical protein